MRTMQPVTGQSAGRSRRETMKTMLPATAAVPSIGIGYAYTANGHDPLPIRCSPSFLASSPRPQCSRRPTQWLAIRTARRRPFS